MTLQNMHVDASVSEGTLLSTAKRQAKRLKQTFRHLVANGAFSIGIINLQDKDLNRVHTIIREIDTRRVFYQCGGDESPVGAKASILEARNSIRTQSSGIWSNPDAEQFVVRILDSLANCQQAIDELCDRDGNFNYDNNRKFFDVLADMRMEVWTSIAALKLCIGDSVVIQHLPEEIESLLRNQEG